MFRPDDFQHDPYGHLTNQGAHGGIVGAGLGLLILPWLPAVAAWFAVVGLYLAYEALIQSGIDDDWRLEWDWRDSLDDTSNVAGGAAVLIGALEWGYWAAMAGFVIWGAALALSTWRRM